MEQQNNDIKNTETENTVYKTVLPVVKFGGSLYVRIDKDAKDYLNIEEGIALGIKMWKIELSNITCPNCGNEFETFTNDKYHDCPKCGKEFLTEDAK